MNTSQFKIRIVAGGKKLFGSRLVKSYIERRYMYKYIKENIIFIHIPKAAGTSVATAIYGKRNGHLKASLVKQRLGKIYENAYTFSVSRNPYDRLLSAYFFACQGFTRDGAISHAAMYQQPVFQSFESFVREWLSKQDLSNIDPVFQPQHLFIFDNGKLLVDDLYKLEQLEQLEQKLSSLLKKTVTIGNKNRSDRSADNALYSSELKEIVYRLYKEDFDLLNYEK